MTSVDPPFSLEAEKRKYLNINGILEDSFDKIGRGYQSHTGT